MKLDSYKLVRYSLALVFVWFGILKILGVSPVKDLVEGTYFFAPEPLFMTILGIGELLIGLLFLYSKTIRLAVVLMWLQMGGIFFGVILKPDLYFHFPNIFLLTSNGEFVVKNFVLLSASLCLLKSTQVKKIEEKF